MHVGYTKIAILDQYMASSRAVNGTTAKCYSHAAAQDRGKLVTFIAGKRRHLLMAGADDKVFIKKTQGYAKTTEQHLTVLSGKSEAALTNNRRVRSMYCTVEANY